MSKRQRIQSFLSGLITLPVCVLMLIDAEFGFEVAILLLCFSLLIQGIRYLAFYVFMARHMVGGKTVLYIGLIILDLGFFTLSLSDVPHFYLMLYLLATHAFDGVIKIMRGREARQLEDPSWKATIIYGSVNIAMALCCLVFIKSTSILVWVYVIGMVYNAIFKITKAFKKSEIVYIQ